MPRDRHVIEGDPAFSPRSVTRRDALRFFIGAGAFAATVLPSVASAETTQEKLDATQNEYTAAQAKLDEIGQQCASLNSDLSATLGQIDTTQSAIDQKQTEIDAKQGQIDQKQTEVEAKQTQLGERMSSAYKTGNQSILDLILSSSSFEELTSNIYYLDKVTEADKEMIEEIKTMKAELETEKTELQTEKDDLETQMSALEDLKSQQQQQLSEIQAKQEEAQTYVSQLDSEVQTLISQRDSELLAAQQEAARVAAARAAAASSGSSSGGSSSGGSSSGGSSSGGTTSGGSGSAAAVVSAAGWTSSTGAGYCAAWVSNVFSNAGVGNFYGNACDMYWSYCTSSNTSSIQTGMIVAVPSEPYSSAAILYGHIGIYIGGGMVRQSVSGVVKSQSLSSWISEFGVTTTPRWGWLGGVVLS